MFPEAITGAVNAFTDFLLRYAIALATVGALSMALIEAWKKIFDTRTKYHMRAVLEWVKDSGAYIELIQLATGTRPQEDKTLMLVHMAYAHSRSSLPRHYEMSLFTLELERMMGHIQEAAEQALRDPRRFNAFFGFLAEGANPDDVKDWMSAAYVSAGGDSPEDRRYANNRASLYSRIHGAAKRKLDGFQLYAGFRWANMNQLASNMLGGAVLFVALATVHVASTGKGLAPQTLLLFLVISAFGGVLAPIAKDLVVALKRVRAG